MFSFKRTALLLHLVALLAGGAVASPPPQRRVESLSTRQGTDRYVFAHFMVGIVGDRTSASDYDNDMQRAKSLGVDAFALNVGTNDYEDTQLGYAYESAAKNGLKVFISLDFAYWSTSDPTAAGQRIAKYANQTAQLIVDGKVFASSFIGDGLDVKAFRAAAGVELYWAPNFHPGTSFDDLDGALNWQAWDSNGNNKAPTAGANVTVEDGDNTYLQQLNGKGYVAPVSPWFFTHYGPEVSYSKNWVFPGDLLWYRRWNDILALKPRFLEIITWNDYGESHYIGPLSSKHYDDGASKWANDMPHEGWLDMAKPYIAAHKAGSSDVASFVDKDTLVYWYRPTLRGIDCDATDTTMQPANNDSGNYFEGRPNGWESLADSVFVVALLTEAGNVTVTSGNNTKTFQAPAGATAFTVDMAVGKQTFTLRRDGQTILSSTSLRDISSICPCGLYNFNAYVGTVPDGPSDPLGPDGLASLTVGLHVTTCSAAPSLGTASPTPASTPASAADPAITAA